MQAAEAKVQKVLERCEQFLVPHYQRPYSWTEKQWATLWQDVVGVLEEASSKPHFLGSIVTAPGRSVPEGVEKRLLIDGQQRLTTVIILLALVRNRARDEGNTKLAERIGDLITNRHEDGSERYKLLPTEGETAADGDRDAFVALIDGRAVTSTSGIVRARTFFDNKLRRADCPGAEDLFRAVTAKLTLVSIILDEHDNPHRIFESLNGKGRPLSQADLIRNYFFMRTDPDHHQEVYRTLWQPMQKRLGEDALTEFIRHYLMQSGVMVKESDVYATLKERIDADGSPVVDHLRKLVDFSIYYEIFLWPERTPSAALRERFARLRRLEVTVAYPFLLPVYDEYARGTLAEPDLCTLLDVIETYVVRRFVCGEPTHSLNKIFTPLYQQAKREGDLVAAAKKLLSGRSCPRDSEFRERIGAARLYGSGERRDKTKLLLERLEAALGHKERVDPAKLTIEHVMPQTVTQWWKDQLGEDWEDDHESLLHTLGNLTLTSYNAELSNETYPEKQTLFATSHMELNRYFETVGSWNAGEIERRADALTELALTVWPYFGSAATPEERVGAGDVTSTLPTKLVFRGREIPVRSWKDVLITTLEEIIRVGPDELAKVIAELGRIISMDPSAFRRSRRLVRLSNGAYVEVNMSAAAIHRVCLQALQLVGVGADEWHVEYTSVRPDDDEMRDGVEEQSNVKQLQHEFWKATREALAATGKFTTLRTPAPRNWYDIAIGRTGCSVSLTANVPDRRVGVKLYLGVEGAGFMEPLMREKHEIEHEIGASLVWTPNPNVRHKTIKLLHEVDLTNRAEWPAAIKWLVQNAVAFRATFAPRLARIELPDAAIPADV